MASIKSIRGERVRVKGTDKTGTVDGIDHSRMLCVIVKFDGEHFARSVGVESLEIAPHLAIVPARN